MAEVLDSNVLTKFLLWSVFEVLWKAMVNFVGNVTSVSPSIYVK